jgi:hypothetical protein
MGAVGTASIVWAGQTGKEDETGNFEYVIVRAVTVSDPLDGPKVVLNAPGVQSISASYYVSPAESDPLALLREKTPARDQAEKTRLRWFVTERYSTKSDAEQDQQKDIDGNNTDDPEEWRDELEVSFYKKNRPVEKATIQTAIPPYRAIGSVGPVVNSAMTVFDPPLEWGQDIMVVRITRRRSDYPGVDWARMTSVNDDFFVIDKPKQGLVLPVQKYQAMMPPVVGSLTYINDKTGKPQPYWKLTFEVHLDFIFGWREDILDRGKHARAAGSDDDNGRGGKYSESEIIAGIPTVRRMRDNTGTPITEPVLLDGKGQPLHPSQQPVYLTYSIIPEMPFGERGL